MFNSKHLLVSIFSNILGTFLTSSNGVGFHISVESLFCCSSSSIIEFLRGCYHLSYKKINDIPTTHDFLFKDLRSEIEAVMSLGERNFIERIDVAIFL